MVLGLAAGLAYGWLIRPVSYVDTAPGSLRADYRTDYILMVAETYAGEADLESAKVRLATLGPQDPVEALSGAIDYAVAHGFSQADLITLNRLLERLRAAEPTPEIGAP